MVDRARKALLDQRVRQGVEAIQPLMQRTRRSIRPRASENRLATLPTGLRRTPKGVHDIEVERFKESWTSFPEACEVGS